MRIRLLKEKDWGWVRERISLKMMEDTQGVVCLNDKSEIVAAAIFDSLSNNGAHCTIVCENAYVLLEGFFDHVYSYVFDHLGKDRVYTYIREKNKKSLAIAETLGLTAKTYFEKGYTDNEGYFLMEVKQDDLIIPSFVESVVIRRAA